MQRPSRAKFVVLAALVGAIAFGGYLGYLAWANDSFPAQQKPFGDYANVTSVEFNGTEYALRIHWLSGTDLPLYVQITSDTSDAANSPICELGFSSVNVGQTIFMPFGTSRASSTPTNVDLWIAVRPAAGSDFTIHQRMGSASLVAGDIAPVGFACTQPAIAM